MTPGMPKQGPPRPMRGGGPPPPSDKMPPPSMPPKPQQEGSGKTSREECLFVRADQHCGSCAHFGEDGSCDVVDGQMQPEDACLRFFEPMGGGEQEEQIEQVPDGDEGIEGTEEAQ